MKTTVFSLILILGIIVHTAYTNRNRPVEDIISIEIKKDTVVYIDTVAKNISLRDSVLKIANSFVGIKELTSPPPNSHPVIDKINAYVGNPKYSHYCAAGNYYCFYRAGVYTVPKSGWSPMWDKKSNRIFFKGKYLFNNPEIRATTGQTYDYNKGRVTHTFIIVGMRGNNFECIDFNYSNQIKYVYRSPSKIYSITEWIK